MKVVGYARYSTDKQTENSIAYQLNKINEYCNNHNITLSNIYIDEASSGTNTDRKGFIDMIADAKLKKFDTIIIYDTSRGSRDVADWFNFRKTMMTLNIEVISCTQHLGRLDNPSDFLSELIQVGLGQHFVLDTRQKSMAGVAEKAKQGQFLGGYAPLGYKIIDGQYHIIESEAKIVRKIFLMYSEGKSYKDIMVELSDVVGRRGKPLSKNTILGILKNERYIGTYTWNKRKMKFLTKYAGGQLNPNVTKIENSIPRIIDDKIWELCQMRIADKKRRAVNKAKREYLLSGLIECAECGGSYVGHTSVKKGSEYKSYICGNKYRNRTCKAKNISAEELESFVVAHVKNFISNTDFNDLANEIVEKINSAKRDITAEKKELKEIETKIKNGINAVLSGIDVPELKEEIENLRHKKSELEEIITATERDNGNVDVKVVKDYLASMTEDLKNNDIKSLINKCVHKIYANTDGTFTVDIGVLIGSCGSTQPTICKKPVIFERVIFYRKTA